MDYLGGSKSSEKGFRERTGGFDTEERPREDEG